MENPICCSMDGKSDQCSSSRSSASTTVVCDKGLDQVHFDYASYDTHLNKQLIRNNMMNKHRWMIPYCTVAAVFIACGALLGLVAVYVELCRANTVLMTNRELIHAQEIQMLNQTHAMDQLRNAMEGPGTRFQGAPRADVVSEEASVKAATGTVYFHWGVGDCPDTSSLVYSGFAASGSSMSVNKGGGGNILCMVSDPEYDMTTGGSQDFRGKIYSLEYRNGNNFGTQSDLHGHDVPCAACMTGGGRQATLMIPGRITCPDNWTREYSGILMSSRNNNVRTSYTCVAIAAESRPGTMVEDGNSSLLYPVEGVCGTGGGLPCGPYVDGNELQCAVCSK
ncbi:uncharacterized protein LOC115917911 [Strongylocentrotus purpuratus]|uniref:Uncharacterized protein n=1 Tax=Strongylocentrotus purpuratus TaxID=7668 RepID=A0A7M7FZU3_STRPU|nr:uncharacterized protein LOC752677 [Strongylocentrotus purpuratus]XP_030829465.1 uncharacterized protein LOC115917911 [Strongylocentrotus purpuratus]|eukprot:XP_001179840.1 PREDICTED: uncharacterized protein LOC752677 isoform X1 [Strongylocentrotus purpuratus]